LHIDGLREIILQELHYFVCPRKYRDAHECAVYLSNFC